MNVVQPEDGKHERKKRGISRKARTAGIDDARIVGARVHAVEKPVLGKVGVEQGVGGNFRNEKEEQKPHGQRRSRRKTKEPDVLAHKFAHPKNIACFPQALGIGEFAQNRV